MSKEGVKFKAVPNTYEDNRKSILWPAVGVVVVFGVLLYWAFDHIYGNCLELKDALTFCSFGVK